MNEYNLNKYKLHRCFLQSIQYDWEQKRNNFAKTNGRCPHQSLHTHLCSHQNLRVHLCPYQSLSAHCCPCHSHSHVSHQTESSLHLAPLHLFTLAVTYCASVDLSRILHLQAHFYSHAVARCKTDVNGELVHGSLSLVVRTAQVLRTRSTVTPFPPMQTCWC